MIDDLAYLTDELGRNMTLRRVTNGSYSPSTSGAAVTTVDYIVKGFILNYKDRNRDGTRIQAGDRRAVIKAKGLTIEPQKTDIIRVDGKNLEIIEVQKIEESGVVVSYNCQVRG